MNQGSFDLRHPSRRALLAALVLGLLVAAPRRASAAEYHYVDWTTATVASGTASGTITLPDGSTVTVQFAASNDDGTSGTLYGVQVSGGTNYWNPSAPFLSAEVENAPPDPDILQLAGGQNQTYKVTLSEPIKDPIMAIVSLGQVNLPTTYDFDSPFTIVSQAPGYWGGTNTSLSQQAGDVLRGTEGHGTIQFKGVFSTFSWTVPTPETWHGFTFGIRTVERLEPSDAGAPDASAGEDAGAADAGEDASTPGTPFDGGPGGVDLGSSGGGVPPLGGGSGDDSCGCSAVGTGHRSVAALLLALVGFAFVASRRRRRRR